MLKKSGFFFFIGYPNSRKVMRQILNFYFYIHYLHVTKFFNANESLLIHSKNVTSNKITIQNVSKINSLTGGQGFLFFSS